MIQLTQLFRQTLVSAVVIGSLELGTHTQAAQDDTWAQVKQAGVIQAPFAQPR